MDANLLFICFLTLVIHVVGTLAYAVRIAGIRTRRIAISFSLFNILALISRTSNSFQGPFLAKRIESRLLGVEQPSLSMLADFGFIAKIGLLRLKTIWVDRIYDVRLRGRRARR